LFSTFGDKNNEIHKRPRHIKNITREIIRSGRLKYLLLRNIAQWKYANKFCGRTAL